MDRKKVLTLCLGFSVAVLAGCSAQLTPQASGPTPTVPIQASALITPYRSTTPRPEATHTAGAMPTAIPSPTPTPRSYQVKSGDDLFGIALRFGVPLEAILTANPTVNPSYLSIGANLEIPFVAVTSTPGLSTPTPAVDGDSATTCYATADGGLWCFITITNTFPNALDNLSGEVILSGGSDNALQVQPAVPPLDHLPAGASMPLVAYFPPAVPQPYSVNGRVLTAIQLAPSDERYLPVQAADTQTEISADKLSAAISGKITLSEGSQPAAQVSLLAVAYGAENRVVGYRKIELNEPLLVGSQQTFALRVYSLGQEIDRVDILVEGRP